jgi:hypothetical protein
LSPIKFYLDENIDPEIAVQLRRRSIEATASQELGLKSANDYVHLIKAKEMGYALCTHDQDFLVFASQELQHHGIIFAPHEKSSIGGWVRALQKLHTEKTGDQLINQVIFLSMKR